MHALTVFIVLFTVYVILPPVSGIPDLVNSDLYNCMVCLCHGVSGCFIRQNCAKYSISESYWRTAGSPGGSYEQCKRNENCILNAIKGYTDSFDNQDCNCDGQYDCRDMLALHLSGAQCKPSVPTVNLRRYNSCAASRNLPTFPLNSPSECSLPEAQ